MNEQFKGIFKLVEEMGELHQVLGKLGAFPDGVHPDAGKNLHKRLIEELGDVMAACCYFVEANALNGDAVSDRVEKKLALFTQWGLPGLLVPPHAPAEASASTLHQN